MNCEAAPWPSPPRQKRPCQPILSSRTPSLPRVLAGVVDTPSQRGQASRCSPLPGAVVAASGVDTDLLGLLAAQGATTFGFTMLSTRCRCTGARGVCLAGARPSGAFSAALGAAAAAGGKRSRLCRQTLLFPAPPSVHGGWTPGPGVDGICSTVHPKAFTAGGRITVTLENHDHETQILHAVPRRAGHWEAWIMPSRRPSRRPPLGHSAADDSRLRTRVQGEGADD
ncbi:hypothetical protein PVAP13_4NG020681 [Panicum virgatum]|uniref:Uncharacterized protein n=1 Tax=Panicum virgatum TaxID=38727 RepID=A0A8T0T0T3_PANVG|nr:hypothetical protein PVAP13_4NG020681 [Panicum virgatum]